MPADLIKLVLLGLLAVCALRLALVVVAWEWESKPMVLRLKYERRQGGVADSEGGSGEYTTGPHPVPSIGSVKDRQCLALATPSLATGLPPSESTSQGIDRGGDA